MVHDSYGYPSADAHDDSTEVIGSIHGDDDTEAFALESQTTSSIGHAPLDHQPSIDFDGDGQGDAYVATVGPQGEQMYVHTSGGRVDAVAVDEDSDGIIDKLLVDSDGDGTVDQILSDTDGDGYMDT